MSNHTNDPSQQQAPQPVYRKEDNELLGCILPVPTVDMWVPATLFSYPLGEATTKGDAIRLLENIGLDSLLDPWEFFDSEQDDWYTCTIVEANPDKVVITISDFGHPAVYATRSIAKPNQQTIRWKKRAR